MNTDGHILAAIHSETDTGMNVERLGVHLGAKVTGIDLRHPIEAARATDIENILAAHGVLVFPNQPINSDQLLGLGSAMGELSVLPFSTVHPDRPELIVYDNKEGNPPPPTDTWHADETFRETPPKITILCSKILPEIGGDTCFASMVAAYDFLAPRVRRFVDDLESTHDFTVFKPMFDSVPDGREKLHHWEGVFAPVRHPVVAVHPITDERVLYVTPQFTVGIEGLSAVDSDRLLDQLYRRPQFLRSSIGTDGNPKWL